MGVLDINTLKLVELPRLEGPAKSSTSSRSSISYAPYAILSHTWGSDEVNFQEMSQDTFSQAVLQKEEYKKILAIWKKAREDGQAWQKYAISRIDTNWC
jgi:hypothetical protein